MIRGRHTGSWRGDTIAMNPAVVSDRIASLPYALLQQEFFMTLEPVPIAVIEEIVAAGRMFRTSFSRTGASLARQSRKARGVRLERHLQRVRENANRAVVATQ